MGERLKTITAEEYALWLDPRHAQSLVSTAIGNWNGAAPAILLRAAGGKLRVAAEEIDWKEGHETGALAKYSLVPLPIVKSWGDSDHPSNLRFWTDGTALYEEEGRNYHKVEFTLYGVRFDPEGLAKIPGVQKVLDQQAAGAHPPVPAPSVPAPAPKPAAVKAPAATPSSAGRPPKDFWEDMVIAATRAILYDDTLQPKTIADVQKWMRDWAIANGHDPGDTALKERARKVFQACRT